VKGSGRGEQQQQRQASLGEEGDFAVHASVYGKVQGEAPRKLMTKREEKEEEKSMLLPELGCLATYVGYVPCVSVYLGQGSCPPHHTMKVFART
jgi:hypothetical protein